jgi:23S rRNA pseudouridine2605 synthase
MTPRPSSSSSGPGPRSTDRTRSRGADRSRSRGGDSGGSRGGDGGRSRGGDSGRSRRVEDGRSRRADNGRPSRADSGRPRRTGSDRFPSGSDDRPAGARSRRAGGDRPGSADQGRARPSRSNSTGRRPAASGERSGSTGRHPAASGERSGSTGRRPSASSGERSTSSTSRPSAPSGERAAAVRPRRPRELEGGGRVRAGRGAQGRVAGAGARRRPGGAGASDQTGGRPGSPGAATGRAAAASRRAGPEGRSGGNRGTRVAPRRPADKRPGSGTAQARGSDGAPELPLRLNKALSGAGLGSRRAVEELVRAGRVSVGGELVQDLGRRVDPLHDRVEVDGSRVVLDERRRYWLLNKPAGVVSTAADPAGRPTVVEMVPEQPRVFPVGRLDRDTEGLLLLTNDGPLAYRLTHARYGVEKRYLAEVERLPADAPARLRQGVELEDGFARPVRVRVVAGSGRRRMVEVVLVEGRNREVRRLLDAVDAPVRRLVRTGVGPIRLTGLAPGEFRPLRPQELRDLYKAAGL